MVKGMTKQKDAPMPKRKWKNSWVKGGPMAWVWNQVLIGMVQWLVIVGQLDATHATSSLSRFSCAPWEGHLKAALQVWEHLKKTKGKCTIINIRAPNMDKTVKEHEANFSDQCPDADEELDDKFPKGLMKELQTTTLADADHGHDKKTQRSATRSCVLVGSTRVQLMSRKQGVVETSACNAEFYAL